MSTARASTLFPIGAELTCVGAGIASTSAATTARTSVRSSNGLILMRMGPLSLYFTNASGENPRGLRVPSPALLAGRRKRANDALWRQTRQKKGPDARAITLSWIDRRMRGEQWRSLRVGLGKGQLWR